MIKNSSGKPAIILLCVALTLLASQPTVSRAAAATAGHGTAPFEGHRAASPPEKMATGLAQQTPSSPLQLRFERITTAEGLSFPIVRDVLQDRQGFMWFATDGGLNCYDGYEFTVYKEDPGDPATIRFDDVSVVYEDSDGTLWVGGGGGLDRFDRTTETFTHVDTRGQVFSICEDSGGTLWAGFWHGLYGYDRATNEVIHAKQPHRDAPADWSTRTQSAVQAIVEDLDGDLWIGTVAGLYQLDRETGEFFAHEHDPTDPTSPSGNVVNALYLDRQGTLWIGTDAGLDHLDGATGDFVHHRHDPDDPGGLGGGMVLSILEDSTGTLWLGTTSGLAQLDRSQDRFLHARHDAENPASLSDDVVTSLCEDRSGVLWVGTAAGISRSNRREGQFTHYRANVDQPAERAYSLDVSGLLQEREPAILSDARVLAVHEDADGLLWIGTFGGGLNRLDRKAGRVTVYRHDPADPTTLSSDRIGAVYRDRDDVLWVGTAAGTLEQFDPETEDFADDRQLGAEVTAIAEDPSGNLWIGTRGEGLYRLASNRLTLEHYAQYWQDPDHWWRNGSLSSHAISTLLVGRAGVLWAGTAYGGVNIWGEAEDRFTHLRYEPGNPNSLAHDQVLSIFEDPSGDAVWFGTGGGGLNRFDLATRTFDHYLEQDGLAGDTVGCILADATGSLWLATIRGLSRFDPSAGTFRNFDRRDGVGMLSVGLTGPGSCLQSHTGELLFGGPDGLYAFRPERIQATLQPPPMAITSVEISKETAYRNLSTDQGIQLSYRDNFLSFGFAALDYTMPGKNQYAYRLEGLDNDWVYAGTRRHADYPDLEPGDYLFRVRGSNSDGIWNEEGAAVRITIEPPIWETWLFRGGVALALLLLAVGLYRQRVQSIEARSQELERQVEQRTREIQELSESARELAVMEERQRLARDLHDAVSQTLFSASLIAEALPELWASSPAEGQKLLSTLAQLSRGALAEMRALLMELRPAALVEASMVELLQQLAQAASGREGIPVTVTAEDPCDLPADVQVALYRIAQEALNNVVKHAQASQVQVSMHCSPSTGPAKGALASGQNAPWDVVLCIVDDGLGFDPDGVPQDRLGLGIMGERAACIGARLEIESEPGWGTRVRVLWTRDGGESDG